MSRELAEAIVADIAAGLFVLRDRDGIAIAPGLVLERARNIAAAILGNYDVKPIETNNGGERQ